MFNYYKSLLIFLGFLFSSSSFAQMYIAADWNVGVVISSDDINNGASSGNPGLAFGINTGIFSPEMFYKRYRFDEEQEISGSGLVETNIKADTLGVGLRVNHYPFLYSKFALGFHFLDSEYFDSSGAELSFNEDLEGTQTTLFFGGGFNYPVADNWELFTDVGFSLGGGEYSVFNWEFGARFYLF